MTATIRHQRCEEAFQRYRRHGDRELRNSLAVEYAWLARSCARRFTQRGEPYDDLVQVAQLGVLKAVERYNPEYGVPFEGFAMPTVLGELRRHFRDHTWIVSPPRRVKELALELGDALVILEQRLGRTPTTDEVARHLGITDRDVLQAMAARRSYRLVPLLAVAGDDDHSGVLAALDADTGADAITVRHALARLDPAERRLLVWRYYDGLTQSEIGHRLGISQAQVSRRLQELLERLRPIVADRAGSSRP